MTDKAFREPLAIIAAVLAVALAQPAAAGECNSTAGGDDYDYHLEAPAEVLDGDTIRFQGQLIHLWAIDAPELGQQCINVDGEPWDCGARSAAVLDALIADNIVRCFFGGPTGSIDGLGRQRAVCHALDGGGDQIAHLNGAMLWNGWAFAIPQEATSYDCKFERGARNQGLGIFAGEVEAPWEWRERGL